MLRFYNHVQKLQTTGIAVAFKGNASKIISAYRSFKVSCKVSSTKENHKSRSKFSNYGSLGGQSQSLPRTVTVSNRYAPLAALDLDCEVMAPILHMDQVSIRQATSVSKEPNRVKRDTSIVVVSFRIWIIFWVSIYWVWVKRK